MTCTSEAVPPSDTPHVCPLRPTEKLQQTEAGVKRQQESLTGANIRLCLGENHPHYGDRIVTKGSGSQSHHEFLLRELTVQRAAEAKRGVLRTRMWSEKKRREHHCSQI